MLQKHPVFSVCLGFLGLYFISMTLFYLRDQDTDEKETWIEKSKAKEEEKQHAVPKTPRNSIAERRPAAAKKSVKVEEEKATQIEEIEEEAEEVPVAKSEKKKNKGKGKGKGKKVDGEALQ